MFCSKKGKKKTWKLHTNQHDYSFLFCAIENLSCFYLLNKNKKNRKKIAFLEKKRCMNFAHVKVGV